MCVCVRSIYCDAYPWTFTSGIIQEEAEVKCGSAAALQRAVDAGRVTVANHKGVDMYYFPSVVLGKREELKNIVQQVRAKAINNKTFEYVKLTMENLGWAINSVHPAKLST